MVTARWLTVALYISVFFFFMSFLHGSFWRTVLGAAKKGLGWVEPVIAWAHVTPSATWPSSHVGGKLAFTRTFYDSLCYQRSTCLCHVFICMGGSLEIMCRWQSCFQWDHSSCMGLLVPSYLERSLRLGPWLRGRMIAYLARAGSWVQSLVPIFSKSMWYWSVVDGYCLIDSLLSEIVNQWPLSRSRDDTVNKDSLASVWGWWQHLTGRK